MFFGRRAPGGLLLTFVLLGGGCRSKSSVPEGEQKPPEAKGAEAKTPEAPSERASWESAESKREAEELLAAWTRAQNAGDFSAYERLYAERFTGTKRVGERATRFDRAGWMRDRKDIFSRPFSVTVEDPVVTAGKDSAIVEFTQTFVTPTFRDSGKKRLVLARADGLRIATEEMLHSSLGAQETGSAELDPRQFSFVVPLSRGLGIVLERGVDRNTVSGEVRLVHTVRSEQVDRTLNERGLDPKWRALSGKTFDLYGAGGRVCSGRVTGFSVWVSIIPHFGTFSSWTERGEPVPEAERALTLWNLSERGGRFLVARLDAVDCDNPRWARESSLPAPRLWMSRAVLPEEESALTRAIRALPVYQEKQKRFTEASGKTTPWEEQEVPRKLEVFDDREGRVYFSAALSGRVGGVCNSPFFEDLWVLFKKQGDGFQLVSAGPSAHAHSPEGRLEDVLAPELAFDLEGDGIPELMSPSDFFRSERGAHTAIWNISPSSFDCPC